MNKKPDKTEQTGIKSESDSELHNPVELETLLGFDRGYTDINGLSKTKRLNLLSKTWSVNIMSHILWSLTDFFNSKLSA